MSSYKALTDPKLLTLIALILSLYDFFKIDDGGAMAFLPDFYEKYEREGYPEWSNLYGTKLKVGKLISFFSEAIPFEAKKEIECIGKLTNTSEKEHQWALILEKYSNEIWANVPLILNRKNSGTLLPGVVLMNYLLSPAIFGINLV